MIISDRWSLPWLMCLLRCRYSLSWATPATIVWLERLRRTDKVHISGTEKRRLLLTRIEHWASMRSRSLGLAASSYKRSLLVGTTIKRTCPTSSNSASLFDNCLVSILGTPAIDWYDLEHSNMKQVSLLSSNIERKAQSDRFFQHWPVEIQQPFGMTHSDAYNRHSSIHLDRSNSSNGLDVAGSWAWMCVVYIHPSASKRHEWTRILYK